MSSEPLPIKKPLSLKQQIYNKLAERLELPVKTVEAIVVHQFNEASSAMMRHNSIEICGFGKFLFMEKKAREYLAVLENAEKLYEDGIESTKFGMDIQSIRDLIKSLKTKLESHAELQTNSGGLEEHSDKE